MKIGIFLFRRDFRYVDNVGLSMLSDVVDIIYPMFNYDPVQANPNINSWFSEKSFCFMQECINDMNPPLIISHDNIIKSLTAAFYKYKFGYLGLNEDYTDFSKKRDEEIAAWCITNNVILIVGRDIKLIQDAPHTATGTNYKKFTPFYNKCIPLLKGTHKKLYNVNMNKIYISTPDINISINPEVQKTLAFHGGRSNFKFNAEWSELNTSHISAYLKYGCVSIREIYKIYINNEAIVRQLIWRDFYYGLPITKGYNSKLIININKKLLNKWKKGKTGYPGIDAGMRQLNQTGFMPNRMRLITASFLVKDLCQDWQEGEKYFATKLIDYDPCQNNGNWAWIAGILGRSSQMFNIKFNPVVQLYKYDPEFIYIKSWLPELSKLSNSEIKLYHTKNGII